MYCTGQIGNDSISLWLTGFEQFFYTWKTLCNIFGGSNAAGMECTHGQLCTWFADGLCRNDTYGFADFYVAACCQVAAVALSADAMSGVTGKNGTNLDGIVVLFNFFGLVIGNFFVLNCNNLAGFRIDNIFYWAAAADTVCQGFDKSAGFHNLGEFNAFGFIHTDIDNRNVAIDNSVSDFVSNDGSCREENISIQGKNVLFELLADEVGMHTMGNGLLVFFISSLLTQIVAYRFTGFEVFFFRLRNNGDGRNEMTVQCGDIGCIKYLALDDEDIAGTYIYYVLIQNGTEKFRLEVHNSLSGIFFGSNNCLFPFEVQNLNVAIIFTDDDILRYVDQTAGQITGVCGTQRGICQTLTGTVGGCEVIQYGQAFTEVSLNWHFYGLTGCIGNQTTHTSQLTNLVVVTTGTRLCHHGQRVKLTHAALHGCAYVVSSLGPDFNNLSVSFIIGNEAASEVCLNTGYLLISFCQNLILFRRYSNVVDTDGNTGYECEMEAQCLYVIQQFCGFCKAQFLEGIVDEFAHLLLADGDTQCFLSIRTLVVEAHWFLEDKVENQTPRGSHNESMAWDIYLDEVMDLKLLQGISQHNFVIAGVAVKLGHIHGVFFCLALFNNGKVVSAQNHFL